MTLAPHLCMVVCLHKFLPYLPEKYDGTINPTKFLQIYSTPSLLQEGMRPSWLTTFS
jgi:hypothetical protein